MKRLTILCPLLGLAACSAVDHPSLAPRAVETAHVPDSPAAEAATGAPASDRIAALVDEAARADAQFRAAVEPTRATIEDAGKAAAGSEAWVTAEQALTRLDTLRGPIMRALADLDALAIARGGAAPDPALEAAIADVTARDAAARATIDQLKGRLSPP